MTAYVVEAAVPRMVNSAGDTQFGVDWQLNDKMVDTNAYSKTLDKEESMLNRNWTTPFQVRLNVFQKRTEKPCTKVQGTEFEYVLQPYDTCVMRIDQKLVDQAVNESIPIYVDHRNTIHSWIETCQVKGECSW